ncbi:hypothetical protein DL764_002031 [Monosporascus ibericus]|uniref:Arabinan endo-1,5-alpha-L-arabinosidase n=1 Tax=Monosporascus ibericus TaxID=155417 RepID=A0A4Q4TM39_9PEZI|nr:hypothetical protein DL764_002031 [Monosporascus ibericus]
MITVRSVAAAAIPLLGSALGYAKPNACSGVCVNTHDPSIIRRDDGTYFRFSTGGRIAVHSAPDITGPWSYEGAALPAGSVIDNPGNQDLWAPEVVKVGNTYYMYYSVSTFGSQVSAIGVATSPSLDMNTWTDLGAIVQSSTGSPFNAIDPSLLNADGQFLLTFGSFWEDIHQVPLADPAAPATETPHQIAFDPVTTEEEGPALFHYGDFYYLFYSKGKCCGYDTDRPTTGGEYKIMVCRSSSPTGGFVDANGMDCSNGGGTVVLESHDNIYGPGGQGVYDDPAHGPILYYHYVDTNIGFADGDKQFGWNNIDFSSGWPVV